MFWIITFGKSFCIPDPIYLGKPKDLKRSVTSDKIFHQGLYTDVLRIIDECVFYKHFLSKLRKVIKI